MSSMVIPTLASSSRMRSASIEIVSVAGGCPLREQHVDHRGNRRPYAVTGGHVQRLVSDAEHAEHCRHKPILSCG